MKKFLMMLVLVFLMAGVAYSQVPVNMDRGDLAIAAGVNFGWDYGLGGSVEYIFGRVDIADVIPVTFGLAVRGGVGFIYSTNYTMVGLVTSHLSLGFIPDLPIWVSRFDFYYGLGLGFGAGSNPGIGLGNGVGIAYYMKPNIALYTSVIYVRYFDNTGGSSGFGSFGLIFKL